MQTWKHLSGLLIVAMFLGGCAAAMQANTPKELSRIAGLPGAAPRSDDAFTFIVTSDLSGGYVPGEWDAAVKQVNLLQPDFVVTVGDLIIRYTEDEEILKKEWDQFDGITQKLDAPFFYCPGNHDVSRPGMLKFYRRRHGVNGKTYYSFNYRGCHFIVINTVTAIQDEAFEAEQLAWLKADLEAAKDARHVFLFGHYPLWEYRSRWEHIRSLLPVDRTTVFHGHWHRLWYRKVDGIPTYILASTVDNRGGDRSRGGFRMFAQVAVSEGRPSVALIPLHEVLPKEFGAHTAALRDLEGRGDPLKILPATGGELVFEKTNPLSVPVTSALEWSAPGWKVEPQSASFSMEASGTVRQVFKFTPMEALPPRPELKIVSRFVDPWSKQETESRATLTPGIGMQLNVPRIGQVRVDGNAAEYANLPVIRIADRSRVYARRREWKGPDDQSFTLRAAHDGQHLYLAVDVTDDTIVVDPGVGAWRNDAVELYWDVRAADQRDGRHGKGTGHVSLFVPEEDGEPRVSWDMRAGKAPLGAKAAFRRREGGYVCEVAIPLQELGLALPLSPGQEISLQVCSDDRDQVEGLINATRMTPSGLGGNERHTHGYIRCTLE